MIVGGVVLPTSVVLVPEVGRGRERAAVRTVSACRAAGRFVRGCAPDTLLFLLPTDGDAPRLLTAQPGGVRRDFDSLDSPELTRTERFNHEFEHALLHAGGGVWQTLVSETVPEAALAAAYFLSPTATLRLLIAHIPSTSHEALSALGRSIRVASEPTGRRVLVVACGELSSSAARGAPGGVEPRAAAFDERLVRALQAGDLQAALSEGGEERAAVSESLWAQMTTLIAAAGADARFDVLAYEAPFGVGYLVATVRVHAIGDRVVSAATTSLQPCDNS